LACKKKIAFSVEKPRLQKKDSFFAPLLVFRKVGVILFYSYTLLPTFRAPTTPRKSCQLLVSKSAVAKFV
ncbi:MAG: hypothetical protein EAZ95_15160, partial [Bacteroidetes bacterium]